MPSRTGLELLVRQTPLTQEEWLNLINRRVALLKFHLDHLTLPHLGDLQYLVPNMREPEMSLDSHMHFLHADCRDLPPAKVDAYLSDWLALQGIFCTVPDSYSAREHIPEFDIVAWGLSRRATWVSVMITYERGFSGDSFMVVKKVVVKETSLEDILFSTALSPRTLCGQLSSAFDSLVKRKKSQLAALNIVRARYEEENALLRLIPES